MSILYKIQRKLRNWIMAYNIAENAATNICILYCTHGYYIHDLYVSVCICVYVCVHRYACVRRKKNKFVNMIYKFEQTIVNIVSRILLMIILMRHLFKVKYEI